MDNTVRSDRITISEARAEAATVLLRILMQEMKSRKLKRIKTLALLEADSIGHPGIREEVEWLFSR